jgi:hypothetical protein
MKHFHEVPRYICSCGGIALMHGKPRKLGGKTLVQIGCWVRGCRFMGRRKWVEVKKV